MAEELWCKYIEKRRTPPHDSEGRDLPEIQRWKKCQAGRCNGNKTNDICNQCKKSSCGKCTGKVVKHCICFNCLGE